MSDVPAAAAWTVATACALGGTVVRQLRAARPRRCDSDPAESRAARRDPRAVARRDRWPTPLGAGEPRRSSRSDRAIEDVIVLAFGRVRIRAGAIAVGAINARSTDRRSRLDTTSPTVSRRPTWPNIQRYGAWLIVRRDTVRARRHCGSRCRRRLGARRARDARWLFARRRRGRLDVLPAVRAVGRVVVSAIPAAGLAGDGDRRGGARAATCRATRRPWPRWRRSLRSRPSACMASSQAYRRDIFACARRGQIRRGRAGGGVDRRIPMQ